MIYTTYFGNYRKFPNDALPLGVTRFKPSYWEYPNIENLAPSENLLRQFKDKTIDEYVFGQKYLNELSERGLTPHGVRSILESVANGRDILLCCYERPGEFCHRHLLANWLGNDIDEL